MISLQFDSRAREFFGVLCLHDYYSDIVCRDLEFSPTPETAALLRNFKLIFKPVDFGFLILYTPDMSEDLLRGLPHKARFSFLVKNRNQRFMNFTDIKFWPEGAVFHYSSLAENEEELKFDAPPDVYYFFKGLGVGELKKKLLHLQEHEYLGRRSPRFLVGLGADGKDEKGVPYDSVVIKDEWGATEFSANIPYKRRLRDAQRDLFRRHLDHRMKGLSKDLSPEQKEKRVFEIAKQLEEELGAMSTVDHAIDLGHVPFGKYRVQFGNYQPFDVYTTDYPDAQGFGIVDIYVDMPSSPLVDRTAKDDAAVVKPQLFHIHYRSRATIWRYVFLNYENSKVTPREVRDENNLITFTEPVESRLLNTGTAMHYCESEIPVPLKDRAQQMLFVSRMNGKRNMKEIRIPTPSGHEMVKPERRPGEVQERIVSEVIVYL